MSSPFLNRIVNYIHRHNIPFEYIDAWVPSFVPDDESGGDGSQGGGESVASGQHQSQQQGWSGVGRGGGAAPLFRMPDVNAATTVNAVKPETTKSSSGAG